VKRVLGILLAAMMLLSLLAACGGKTTAPDSGTPSTGNTDNTPGETGEQLGDAKYGGTFYYNPGSDGPSTFGYPWNQNIGFSSVTEPFAGYVTAQWPDGSIRLVHSKGYTEGYDEEKGLYWVEHELWDNVYLHPHELDEAEQVNAELVVWNAYMMKEKAYWASTLVEVEATGEFTFRTWHTSVSNSTPLSNGCGWMVSRKLYEEFGEEYMDAHPISSGPYRVVENVPGSHVMFERYDNYFEEGEPYYDAIQIVYLGEVQMQNIALESDGEGRIDAVATNTAEQAGMFKDKGYHIMALANQTITFVMSNQLPADHPLMDLRVRQAISMAIDREMITQALGFGVHTPAYQQNPPNFAAHNYDPDYGAPRYDPEGAKALMAEAGYADGFTTTLIPAIGSVTENQAVAISNYLAEIGIVCEIEIIDGTALSEMVRQTGWGEALYIGNYISWFTAEDTASANFRHVEGAMPTWVDLKPSAEFEQMILDIAKLGDNSAEAAVVADLIIDNLDLIPLWYQGRYHIIHPRVGGYAERDHMLFFDNIYQK